MAPKAKKRNQDAVKAAAEILEKQVLARHSDIRRRTREINELAAKQRKDRALLGELHRLKRMLEA